MKQNITGFFIFLFVLANSLNIYGQSYCTTGLFESDCIFGDDIHSFTFGAFSQLNTGCSPNGYGDYTGDTIFVNQGLSYDISLSSNYDLQYYAIWIDYNSNGNWDDTGEMLWASTIGSGAPGTFTNVNLTIPINAAVGVTRLRARANFAAPLTADMACALTFYGEVHDITIKIDSAPPCIPPVITSVTDITNVSATLNFISPADALSTTVQYGLAGFTLGNGTLATALSSSFEFSNLMQNTNYDVYIQANCPDNELSDWVGPFAFSTLPDNVLLVTYTDGMIESYYQQPVLTSDVSPCAGSLTVNVPEGFWITSVNTTYSITAGGGTWMNEMRSRLWSPTLNGGESEYFTQGGTGGGTQNYERNGITAFFGLYGEVEFQLDLKRIFGGPGCDNFSFVVPDSWTLMLLLDTIPPCVPPIGLQASLQGPNNVLVNFNSNEVLYNIAYGPVGFNPQTQGTTIEGITELPYLISGLAYNTNYHIYVQNDCDDDGMSDFSGPFAIGTLCQAITVTAGAPSCQGFANNGNIPACWQHGAQNQKNWQFSNTPFGNLGQFGQFSGNTLSGGYFAYLSNSWPAAQGSALITPYYNIASLSFPQLTFHLTRHAQGGEFVDFRVEVQTNTGWEEIYFSNEDVYPWQQIILNLSSVIGDSDFIRFRFIVDENNGFSFMDDIAIDDVCVREAPVNDLGVTAVISPLGASCDVGSGEPLVVNVYNYGSSQQTIFLMYYSINGGTPVQEYYNSTLNSGDDLIYTFDQLLVLPDFQTYEIKAWTTLLSGLADEFPANDTAIVYITKVPTISEFPYQQDFENGDGGWTSTGTGTMWQIGQPGFGAINSANSGLNAAVTNLTGPYLNTTLSYFNGPCFDFSSLDNDPVIQFALNVATETFYDGAWLEKSINGGQTWTKVADHPIALNWYNNEFFEFWDGFSNGWIQAKSLLQDVAGESDVRLRFVFSTDFSVVYDGVGVDDILIYEPVAIDASPTGISVLPPTGCLGQETVEVIILNAGTASINFAGNPLEVELLVNGANVQSLSTVLNTGSLASYESMTVAFTVDMTNYGVYQFEAITNLSGDLLAINDSINGIFNTPLLNEVAYYEGFEQFAPFAPLPEWITNGFFVNNAGDHFLPSKALSANVWGGNPMVTAISPLIGPVEEESELIFQYRITNWPVGNEGAQMINDSLSIAISTDCGISYTTIHQIHAGNHTVSAQYATVNLDISSYEGENLMVRWTSTSAGMTDVWVDIDNFVISGECPENLDLTITVTNQESGLNNGAIIVQSANPHGPFTYVWSHGASTALVTGLPSGTYQLTITNVFGCSEEIEVFVDLVCPQSFFINAAVTDESASGQQNGAIQLTSHGGQSPFSFQWSNNDTTANITGLTAGNYTVTITDANGCTDTGSFSVGLATNTGEAEFPAAISIFPNPGNDQVFIEFHFPDVSDLKLKLYTLTGKELHIFYFERVQSTLYELNTTQLPDGIYFLHFESGESYTTRPLIITR